jgi:transposase
METLSMSKKEIDQISILESLKEKRIKQRQAALMLNLSIRQVKRKLKRYRLFGTKGLIHGNRGRPGNRKLDLDLVLKALSLIKNHYPDFTPTFASEKLEEIHGLIINRETLRIKMTEAGLWLPKQKRTTHRDWRERKAHLGELVQFDGSPHKWFEDRAQSCTLLAFIDDASSKILWLEFVYEEATVPIMKATKSYLEKLGRPLELYVDRGKVFKVNLNNSDNEKITQYRRSLNELGINVIYARSPEAKGRVERLFGTLQDRLVKELRLAGISTMEEANQFVQNIYLSKHNQRFAVGPREKQDFHRTVKGFDLNEIFTKREERTLTNDFTITYHHMWYQLVKKQPTLVFPKDTITVLQYLNGNIRFKLRSVFLNLEPIHKPAERNKPIVIKGIKKPWIPPIDHPWRRYQTNHQQKVTFLNC